MNPLIGLLHEKQEDRFIVVLKELSEDPSLVKRFLEKATDDAQFVNRGHRWHASSHVKLPEGIADLVFQGDGARSIVEAKIGAPFNDEQPQNYARYLSELKKSDGIEGRLVVLAPKNSIPYYLTIGRARLEEAGLARVPFSAFSWEELAELCKDLASDADATLKSFLLTFAETIGLAIGSLPRPLTDREAFNLTSPEVTNALRYAMGLVDPLLTSLRETLKLGSITTSNGAFFNGKYITFKKLNYWIGVWIDVWVDNGRGPLWIQTTSREADFSDSQLKELDPIEFGGTWLVPLPLASKISTDEQVVLITKRIKSLIEIEANAG